MEVQPLGLGAHVQASDALSALEFRRVVLDELALAEAEGWRPAVELPCGAVGADPWCAGTLAIVTVVRKVGPATPPPEEDNASLFPRERRRSA